MTSLQENPQTGRYYVDTNGVVETRPSSPSESILPVKAPDNPAQKVAEQHMRKIKDVLSNLAPNARNAEDTRRFARNRLYKLRLPTPGFIDLGDEFYTGWFFTHHPDGSIFAVFRANPPDVNPPKGVINMTPYFQFKEDEAKDWELKVKERALFSSEIDRLKRTPHEDSHPFYRYANDLDLNTLNSETGFFLDNFWGTTYELFDTGQNGKLAEHLSTHLLKIAILYRVNKAAYRRALAEVREQMKVMGVTVFPLDEQNCMVVYLSSTGKTIYRGLPLPQEKARFFQRYRSLGEPPLTITQFIELYAKLVDPNPNLFKFR